MNVRNRWWLAGALLCLSAVYAQRGRAQEAPAPALARALLGPLQLVRPLAPETLERMLDEAESMYRSRNLKQAQEAYGTLVEIDRLNTHAWLRLGNLHQQAGQDTEALEAYRHASLTVPDTAAAAEARGKALLNIALLNVAHASRAIDELDAMNVGSLKAQRDAVGRQIGAERRRVHDAAMRPAASAASAASAGAVAPSEFEPYTVDRWVAKPRSAKSRRNAGREAGRAAVAEPITESPLPDPPRIEVLRGGAAGTPKR